MKRIQYIKIWVCNLLFICISFTGCEFDEPFPDPLADFTIWGTNPATNAYEQVTEPYNFTVSISYDFIVEGTGQQFVFWFGVDGDPESNTPVGSNFNDRGLNHISSGEVTRNNKCSHSYGTEGTYEVVLVSSSYKYSTDEYKESITRKTVQVVAAK